MNSSVVAGVPACDSVQRRRIDTDRLFLLVGAVVAASPTDPEVDHPRLPSLLDEIIALDPTSSKDTIRLRNWLLLNLWPAFGDQASLDRAYKAARGPQAKGDLSRTLPRHAGQSWLSDAQSSDRVPNSPVLVRASPVWLSIP